MDSVQEQRLARARQRSVMICTPIGRQPSWEYTASLANALLFLPEQGIRCSFQFVVGASVLHKARNELVAHFLMSDFTDLLFVDDDMGAWTGNTVLRLLASDKLIIGGVGRMRVQKPNTDPNVWCWRPIVGENGALNQDEMGAIEALGFGTAFMLINRGVFAKMVEKHPEWKRSGASDWDPKLRAHYFEFFRQNHEGETRELSEDYVFCERWRQLGGKVFVDPTIRLSHVGSFAYAGALEETLTAKDKE